MNGIRNSTRSFEKQGSELRKKNPFISVSIRIPESLRLALRRPNSSISAKPITIFTIWRKKDPKHVNCLSSFDGAGSFPLKRIEHPILFCFEVLARSEGPSICYLPIYPFWPRPFYLLEELIPHPSPFIAEGPSDRENYQNIIFNLGRGRERDMQSQCIKKNWYE